LTSFGDRSLQPAACIAAEIAVVRWPLVTHPERITAAVLILLAVVPVASGAIFHRRRFSIEGHASGITQRRRLHVDDLIAEPGTVEIDSGVLYSWTTGAATLPTALKFTPEGGSLLWGRTEYSVLFDSVASAVSTGARSTQFSDRITVAATSVLYDSEHFDVAIAPQITALLRNDSGSRWGATLIARYDNNGSSLGVTAGWTFGTDASDTNPAGVWDFGVGYGHPLGRSGLLQRLTPQCNVVLEKSTGFGKTLSAFAGVEYQVNKRLAVDLTGQRYAFTGGGPDRQVLLSFTINTGK